MTILTPPSALAAPEAGQLVVVRDRHWVVTGVDESSQLPDVLSRAEDHRQHLVSLSSVEDDGLGQDLAVVWELEPGSRVLDTATLPRPLAGHFDAPDRLAAFLDAVRWGAITSADSKALQAPFRSGITIEDYQLDPVVRALRMPRVNLLIADDVGLGKTIEAGLVVQELLLRHRARTVHIACPASLTLKWQAEMAEKFGLDFVVVDSALLHELRRQRGVGANPFKQFPRLIVSIDWLKGVRAQQLLADVLPPEANAYPRRFDLLIVDEVHQAAPAGRGRYATDSLRTKAISRLARHFEHRLFLSATPHNGYSESFEALLEMLDPQRFARGVRPDPVAVSQAMVRRMKSDLRRELPPRANGSPRFAERKVVALEVDYPKAERDAHADLVAYTDSRRRQAKNSSSNAAADFITLLLKKRLFSSPAAFHHTLTAHLETMAGEAANRPAASTEELRVTFDRLEEDVDLDDDLETATEDALVAAAEASGAVTADQQELLHRMLGWAEEAKGRPDAKAEVLFDFLERTCRPSGAWNDERVIVFTEYRHTQLWLEELLTARGLGGDRLALLYGGMDAAARERIKAEFQGDPSMRPVRILLCTDAASEGIDLQKHCHRLVNVEIPFSPTRLEQRAGRIDRHGQPSAEVFVHHFVGAGFEDAPANSLAADLQFLSLIARKVDAIRDDLGTAGPVLADQVEEAMLGRRRGLDEMPLAERKDRAARTLTRIERNLREEIARLRDELDHSAAELGISPERVERVVRLGLELAHQAPLEPTTLTRRKNDRRPAGPAFRVPDLTRSWATAAVDLPHPLTGARRPVTFDPAVAGDGDDVVYAHLGHRLVAQATRLLRAEVWASGSDVRLARVTACLVPDAALPDLVVAAHARLVVTGGDGRRLHEEVIAAGGRVAGGRFARFGVKELDAALATGTERMPGDRVQGELEALWPAIERSMFDALQARAEARTRSLERTLAERADHDVAAITTVLSELRSSIAAQLDELETSEEHQQLIFDFAPPEREQHARDIEALRRRIDAIPGELKVESEAIRRRYAEPQPRLFPAAVTFLVPRRLAAGIGATR